MEEVPLNSLIHKLKKHQFLFEELVKRDFKQKYKRTVLGMFWSILAPLLTLLVMNFIFGYYFGRRINHYTIYLFCGNIIYSYFRESTNAGMVSLISNAGIFTKVNVPKYLFLFSKNVSILINFGLTLILLFIFILADGIPIGAHFIALLYPVVFLVLFNLGVGLILSALFVFFRDISYLYNVFTLLLMYMSAIFYRISIVPAKYRMIFYCNPVYCYIEYFRTVILDGKIPSLNLHLLCAGYAIAFFIAGYWMYKKNNHKFLFYV